MHFEFLVEDISGKMLLESLIPNIVGDDHTYKVIAYKGIGRIPPKLKSKSDASKRILMDQLPKLLRGYGKQFSSYPKGYEALLIIVCDLDDKNYNDFLAELNTLLHSIIIRPNTQFCISVEEGEAWLLGDSQAIISAYPNAKESVLNSYKQDSICGTWEVLADAIYEGGSQKLKKQGWQIIGAEKYEWAKNIGPLITIEDNKSPSFMNFVSVLKSHL